MSLFTFPISLFLVLFIQYVLSQCTSTCDLSKTKVYYGVAPPSSAPFPVPLGVPSLPAVPCAPKTLPLPITLPAKPCVAPSLPISVAPKLPVTLPAPKPCAYSAPPLPLPCPLPLPAKPCTYAPSPLPLSLPAKPCACAAPPLPLPISLPLAPTPLPVTPKTCVAAPLPTPIPISFPSLPPPAPCPLPAPCAPRSLPPPPTFLCEDYPFISATAPPPVAVNLLELPELPSLTTVLAPFLPPPPADVWKMKIPPPFV